MRKAQTQQVFIYLMVIIVVGAVLLIGYRSVDNILDRSCEVDISSFRGSLSSDLDQNTRTGRVASQEYRVPCSYSTLCFVGEGASESSLSNSNIPNSIIPDIEAETGNNIFLLEGDIVRESFSMQELIVENDDSVLCLEAQNNRFFTRFEGSAGSIIVSSQDDD